MTPTELAEMEAICFPDATTRWSEADYAKHLKSRSGITISDETGYVVGQIAADEAEIISLGVLPGDRKEGHGTDLLARFETKARSKGANVIFLEVAIDNAAALALYKTRNFHTVGRRREYYESAEGISVDAFILKKSL